MRTTFAILSAATVIGLAACGSSEAGSPSPPQSSQAGASVGVTSTGLGTFLVGAGGKTLYLFEADSGTQSTCTGGCTQTWPPLTTSGAPVGGSGVTQSLLSTTQRSDGSQEVLYHGHPLYYYAGDTKPGDTNGEGLNSFGAGWDVVSAAGNKIEKP